MGAVDVLRQGDGEIGQAPSEVIEVVQRNGPDEKTRVKPLVKPMAQTTCTRENCVIAEVSDDEMECEDGASPALLGGFIVPACAEDEVDLDEKRGKFRHLNNEGDGEIRPAPEQH